MDTLSKYALWIALCYAVLYTVEGCTRLNCIEPPPYQSDPYDAGAYMPRHLPTAGHYHLHRVEDGVVDESHYQILEVAADGSVVYKWTGLDEGVYGAFDRRWNRATIGRECFYIDADYRRLDSYSFTMTENQTNEPPLHYLARRYHADECDREREYFREQMVRITLPYQHHLYNTPFHETPHDLTVYLGRSRHTGADTIQYASNGYAASLRDYLAMETEPPSTAGLLPPLRVVNLFVDRNVPDALLEQVFAEMRTNDLHYYRRITRSHQSGPDFGLYSSGVYRLE